MPYGVCGTARGFESRRPFMPKGANPKHTACRPGTKVIIKPIKGEPFVDIFVERKGGAIFLKNHGKISKGQIKSFAVYKERVMHK